MSVSRETSTIDLFYSPSQPRAADGKWTDGAGGGAAKASARMAGWQKFRETEAAGDQELDAITKYMAAEITDTERDAIEYMKSDSGAGSVGHYLRYLKDTPDEAKWLVKDKSMAKAKAATEAMDGLMADIPALTEPITMYRGYRDWTDYLPEAGALTGTQLVDKGFMFTSADKSVAQYYADQMSDEDAKTLMVEFEVPAGAKVLPFWGIHESYVDDNGEYTSKEAYAEVLLPRGATLDVTGVTNRWKGYTANADYTP